MTKKKKSVEEILAHLDEEEKVDAAIDAVEKMSDEEVTRDVAAAGIDVERIQARVLARAPVRELRPRRPWVPVAIAGGLALAAAILIYGLGRNEGDVPVASPFDAGVQDAGDASSDGR